MADLYTTRPSFAALLDALPKVGKENGLKVIGALLSKVSPGGKLLPPPVPKTDASEVLGDTAQIEACKERLRPTCCLVLCVSTCPPRLRCQGNALVLWISLLCPLLCSLLRFLLCCCRCSRGSCRPCKWLGAVVEQQQYKLHPKAQAKAAADAPPGAHLTGCAKVGPEERDPFFCVGEYSVALQPPKPFPVLCWERICCCFASRSAAAQSPAQSPPGKADRSPLGKNIDHLHLVEGLLTAHCSRTFELALLAVLSCGGALGAAFFFTAQAIIRAGLVPYSNGPTAADLYLCTEGGVAVLSAPQALSCFRGEARVDPDAALGFAQAMAATGGMLTYNASQLAAATCAPVLGAMSSTVSLFFVPGLIQRVYNRLAKPYAAEISPWPLWLLTAWSLVPLAALLLIGLLAYDKRSPVPRKADSLRLLLTAEAREFMMSYAWNFPSADNQRARVIAHLLPDCWLDVQALTLGASVPDVITGQAVWARCLVVYGTRHYFTSKNCLRELLSALLFREDGRAKNIVLLLDEDKCDKANCDSCKQSNCDSCKDFEESGKTLDDIGKRLKDGWPDVKVCKDLPEFWEWVGARGGADDVKPLLEWYREVNGRPRALQLTDRLSNLVHTEPMFETGLCVSKKCCDFLVRRQLSWCCQCLSPSPLGRSWASTRCWRTASCQRIKHSVRFGQLLYDDDLSLLETRNGKETLYVYAVLALIVTLGIDLNYSPPQRLSINSGSPIAAFTFLISAFDVFTLLICILVLLPSGWVTTHQTRPSTYYTNFLEPLVIAAHLPPVPPKQPIPPSAATTEIKVTVNPLYEPAAAPPTTAPSPEDANTAQSAAHLPIYLVSSHPDCSVCCRQEQVYKSLKSFLVAMGFCPEAITPQQCEGKLDTGLFVWFMNKGEAAMYLRLVNKGEAAMNLRLVEGVSVDRIIPVLFDESCEKENFGRTLMTTRLYVAAFRPTDKEADDERLREIGADIIQALSKRVASALLGKVENAT